jgi:hypothetical protein
VAAPSCPLQIDDRTGEAVGILPDGVLDGIGDRGEVVGRKGGIAELEAIVEPSVADLVSTDHAESAGSQDLGGAWREVLVEVERHPAATNRTSPGSRCSITSAVSAAFASPSRRISSGYTVLDQLLGDIRDRAPRPRRCRFEVPTQRLP